MHIRFSQTSSHFIKRFAGIPFKPNNWGNLDLLRVWDLMQYFAPIVTKTVYFISNFYNKPLSSGIYVYHFAKTRL